MDSTGPAPASIVGSTNAADTDAFRMAFALDLVERLPAPTWLHGRQRASGTDGGDYATGITGSYPRTSDE